MSIKDLPKNSQPREKLFSKGPANLKDKELLAILFRTGIKGCDILELSARVLKRYPINKLSSLTLKDFQQINGIDQAKAATLLAAAELSKRMQPSTAKPVISSPQSVLPFIDSIRTKAKEYFVAIYLNARNEVIHQETISVGTVNSSLVHPREVFEPAIRYLASSIVIAHNHPSGSLEKSNEDQLITDKLSAAGQILGIEILDHLIVTGDCFVSFKEHGWL